MRTKTLLIAAAALAATVISSEAQVYSANVVGYVNIVSPGGSFICAANPLTTGNDVLTNVFTSVPGATQIQLWDPVGSSYNTLTYSGPVGNRHWKDSANNVLDNTIVAPGQAFFFVTTSPFTNTFVGSVVAPSGGSATNVVNGNSSFQLIASAVPYGGSISNTIYGLSPAGGSTIQKWNPVNQTFTSYTYSGAPGSRTWKDGSLNTVDVQMNVGEGFFFNTSPAQFNWVQTLP